MGTKQNILIVGAGFAGATIARELAENDYSITVIDKRNHIGGNAYDYVNEHGILIHKYGAHIFHTSNETVFNYLSRFTEWVEYKHKVVAMLEDGSLVNFPPTKAMVEKYGIDVIKKVFYEPYTKKMWGIEIDESIINRVPIRNDNNDLYFPNDTYQYLPKFGYTSLFSNMLNHANIKLFLNTEFSKDMEVDYDHVFNSMPIDVYYDYKYGVLPYRSIKFTHVDLPFPQMSDYPVVNFTHDGPQTRVVEWKNFPNHGVNNRVTTVTYETPCDYKQNNNERYYPVKDIKGLNRNIYNEYKNIQNDKVTFIGRCGMYVYIDMHQAVSSSLSIAKDYVSLV
jgi:UDP-galactopyranose mutase